jgi:hypothetical protein
MHRHAGYQYVAAAPTTSRYSDTSTTFSVSGNSNDDLIATLSPSNSQQHQQHGMGGMIDHQPMPRVSPRQIDVMPPHMRRQLAQQQMAWQQQQHASIGQHAAPIAINFRPVRYNAAPPRPLAGHGPSPPLKAHHVASKPYAGLSYFSPPQISSQTPQTRPQPPPHLQQRGLPNRLSNPNHEPQSHVPMMAPQSSSFDGNAQLRKLMHEAQQSFFFGCVWPGSNTAWYFL